MPSTMGTSSSTSQNPLVAQPVPIGVFSSFVSQQEIVLLFPFGGEELSVKDVNGNVMFHLSGRAFSLKQKKGALGETSALASLDLTSCFAFQS